MFARLFHKPLILSLEEQEFRFATVGDFEFALSGRTHVTYERVQRSLALSNEELRNEAQGIKDVEKHFVDVLSGSYEDNTTIGRHMRTMDIKLFSQDHDWRTIIGELHGKGDEFDDFKRVALVKYMQYLTSRQEVVQAIYADRKQRMRGPDEESRETSHEQAMRETVIFDLEKDLPTEGSKESLARMPKGEVVSIPLQTDAGVTVVLSRHRYTLHSAAPAELVSEAGERYPLQAGRNFIGRQGEVDVSVDNSFRDVSRKHLIIDVTDKNHVQLTDISSHGTFVSPIFLDHTGSRTVR